MARAQEIVLEKYNTLIRFIQFFDRLNRVFLHLRSKNIFSEDTLYKWHFARNFIPELYKQHLSELYANCVFCNNLVRSGCHRHCLKCSRGTYIHCSPALPGMLYYETSYPYNQDYLTVPWYYKETCSHFRRLPQSNYLRNLNAIFSSVGIYNFEVLEGLVKGLASGERPCHVCASIDYDIYRRCLNRDDYNPNTPCVQIASELGELYRKQSAG